MQIFKHSKKRGDDCHHCEIQIAEFEVIVDNEKSLLCPRCLKKLQNAQHKNDYSTQP